ncbi:hypothetical protein [Streptomyces sp. c-19]|uniref:hypothetical protein n=1 Tax=Streptomyces sp. c-19 TaxID=2789275 RepID=UPI003980F3DB
MPLPHAEDYPEGRLSLRTRVATLIGDPVALEVLKRHLPGIADSELLQFLGPTPLLDIAAMSGGMIPPHRLRLVAEELAKL